MRRAVSYLSYIIVTILLRQHQLVADFIRTAGLREQVQKLLYSQVLLLLAGDIDYHVTVVHHDQAITMGDGITHVVGDHNGGQFVLGDDAIGGF